MDLRTYGGQPFEEEYVSSITEARAARLAEPDRGEFLSLTRALETPSSRAGDDDRMLARLGGLASRADAYDPAPPTAGPGDEPVQVRGEVFASVWSQAAQLRLASASATRPRKTPPAPSVRAMNPTDRRS